MVISLRRCKVPFLNCKFRLTKICKNHKTVPSVLKYYILMNLQLIGNLCLFSIITLPVVFVRPLRTGIRIDSGQTNVPSTLPGLAIAMAVPINSGRSFCTGIRTGSGQTNSVSVFDLSSLSRTFQPRLVWSG